MPQPNEQTQENQETTNQSGQQDTNDQQQEEVQSQTGHTSEPDEATLLRAALAENHQRLTAMQSQLEQLTRQAAPAEPSTEELNQRYFTDPVGVVRDELNKALKPIVELRNQFTRDTELTRIKGVLKRDPQFGKLFDGEVEGIYDQLMAQSEAREDIARAALVSAIGIAASHGKLPSQQANKELPKPNAADSPNAQAPKVNTPAHLRPSGNPAPQNNDKPARRQLNEHEKLLARRAGQTDEEFLDELEKPFTLTRPQAK